jgi:hypothetical protein
LIRGTLYQSFFRYIGACDRWDIVVNQLVRGKNRRQIYKLLRLLANLGGFCAYQAAFVEMRGAEHSTWRVGVDDVNNRFVW